RVVEVHVEVDRAERVAYTRRHKAGDGGLVLDPGEDVTAGDRDHGRQVRPRSDGLGGIGAGTVCLVVVGVAAVVGDPVVDIRVVGVDHLRRVVVVVAVDHL